MSKTGRYLLCGVLFSLLVGCESRPTDKGQQYKDGHLTQNLQEVANVNSPVCRSTARLSETGGSHPDNLATPVQSVQRELPCG